MPPASRYINPDLRQFVAERAEHLCEYCLIHEDDTYLGCEIDHIISLKHGGISDADNLAYACTFCNRHKGSDVGSVLNDTEFVRFYNPRQDQWSEHFHLEGLNIRPLTSIGEATAKILLFNAEERLLERESLIEIGRYPSLSAMKVL
ncbi:MAG: HNH endonuclease signature motif containing protein [Candidatus Electrothrix sp. Rat3]|nr:HNH endonuclease signature motif containing protein [Candidatus Electrothrix rattekaaiensis]